MIGNGEMATYLPLKKGEIEKLANFPSRIIYLGWLGRGKLGKSTAANDAIFFGVRCG